MPPSQELFHHPIHYLSLVLVFVLGLWSIYYFRHNSPAQLIVVIALDISYVTWGIVHHWLHRDLHPKIIGEYLLVAFLALLIFASVLYRT